MEQTKPVRRGSGKRERLVEGAGSVPRAGGRAHDARRCRVVADVPLGNVYYYFKTKDQLVEAALEAHADAMREMLRSAERHRTPRARRKAMVRVFGEQRDVVDSRRKHMRPDSRCEMSFKCRCAFVSEHTFVAEALKFRRPKRTRRGEDSSTDKARLLGLASGSQGDGGRERAAHRSPDRTQEKPSRPALATAHASGHAYPRCTLCAETAHPARDRFCIGAPSGRTSGMATHRYWRA